MAPTTPAAPSFLPAEQKKTWKTNYEKALDQAKNDFPESESDQRAFATKEANRMLKVAAPKSADDIEALEEWQVLHRGRRARDKKQGGGTEVFCVTIDGKKHSFVAEEKPAKGGKKADDKSDDSK